MPVVHTNAWNRIRYSLYSPVYDLIGPFTRHLRRRSLSLARTDPDDRILLVGAGTGLDLEFLPRNASVMATDITPAMLRRLELRARRLKMPNVTVKREDGQNLTFPDASFDLVVLHLILAVIPDPVRCIREAARVVRAGGHVLIMDKFAPDHGAVPLYLRLLNPLMAVIATDVARQLQPIIAATDLEVIVGQPLALGGLFKCVLLRKP